MLHCKQDEAKIIYIQIIKILDVCFSTYWCLFFFIIYLFLKLLHNLVNDICVFIQNKRLNSNKMLIFLNKGNVIKENIDNFITIFYFLIMITV